MKVYITGSTGMVGRNLVDVFTERGHEVVTSSSKQVNLLDFAATRDFLRANAPDLVIHAAGKVGGIQANIKDSYGFFLTNMQMGLNLVSAAREVGIPRLLNLSSSCSYPCNLSRPLTEMDAFAGPLEPTNEGYAIAKAATLRLCVFASRQFSSCHYKTLVPCNLYGRYDKFGEANSHMIPAVIRKLDTARRQGIDRVAIWGDGEARREFMYAGDLADIIERCAVHFDDVPDVMNVGLGFDYTVNEYYAAIAEIVGYNGAFDHDLTRPVGMRRKLLDVSLMQRLGLKAMHSLADGIAETYQYYRQSEWSSK